MAEEVGGIKLYKEGPSTLGKVRHTTIEPRGRGDDSLGQVKMRKSEKKDLRAQVFFSFKTSSFVMESTIIIDGLYLLGDVS